MSKTLDQFSLESFSQHQGEAFRIRLEDHSIDVQLADVESQRNKAFDPSSGRREPFSLLFIDPQGSVDCYLPQGTYRFEGESWPALDLFIVPIGPPGNGGAGMCYEAQFT
jgi:hypothetical protein